MPSLAAISKIDFPYKVEQKIVKEGAMNLFAPSYPQVDHQRIFGMSSIESTKHFI